MHRADGWARWVALLATTFVAGVMALLLFLVVGSPFFGGASNVALERHDLTAKPPALAITRSTADLATQLAVRSDAGDYACDRPPVVGGSVANAPPTSASAESDRFSLTSRSARIAGGEAYGQAGNPAERAGVLAVLAGDALATKDAVATTHPVTGVEMRDGFPVFEPQHDFALGPDLVDASDYRQMSAATRDLRATLEKNPTRWRQFTSEQQDAIRAGNDRIPDYTWHHHEDGDTLQLVDRWTHSKTGHDGGRAITGTCR